MKIAAPFRILSIWCLACGLAAAEEVILHYEARVLTAPFNTPFGLTPSIGTPVSGTFTYEKSTAIDSSLASDRGTYLLTSGGGFTAKFLGHEVTGSATPVINIENFDFASHTFRFTDGDRQRQFPMDQGIMSFDGIAAEDIGVSLSISDATQLSFENDDLPAKFPMTIEPDGPEYFVTFVIDDERGSMSLEIIQLSQALPTPPLITDVGIDGTTPTIVFDSQPGQPYDVEFSADLETWTTISTNLEAEDFSTEFTDDGLTVRLGSVPERAYYRVRESNL